MCACSGRSTRMSNPTRPMIVDIRPLVLVVDDYKDAREMYAEYLMFSGFLDQAHMTSLLVKSDV